MNHIPKMLRFGVMQLFQIPLTAAGGSLASSLRFASLAIIIVNVSDTVYWIFNKETSIEKKYIFRGKIVMNKRYNHYNINALSGC